MWPYPRVIAHRGGGTLAPENTLAGFLCGMEHGYRAVEFDVMLTADEVPVLMHDARFGRTVAGSGEVAAHSAQELLAMDAGSWVAARFTGVTVPSLEQALSFCQENGIWMNVEIKPSAPAVAARTGAMAASVVAARFAAHIGGDPAALPLLSSFAEEALAAAREAAPGIPRALLVDAIPADWRERLVRLDAVALHVNQARLTAPLAAEIKGAGYGLFCYTVNDVARADEILSWGVDGFCTDRIDVIGSDFADSAAMRIGN
ncbi:glycerophosphodiester phosphodiesterase [Herbaspirillum sp. RTI4]|uniref:glycerophosphodiester phosphodiesterase n=1 Tax=Herbaspirillum sp. RTI4 TaxID=3048640 RepID=UPI002AB42BE1|nr:glycerophosphodiester phosphodiesterase [Herbaspirillum sp. RTI4]MDY7579793.1 glycerophosphodiester phosphodiesterase [Herbaspirillum sp. RTI4]MEA9982602.1 glycerophosphodiester phosphodiesterase [Herbaspirillum sp. RTI4]